MCDYSLAGVKTRPAKVGDKLVTQRIQPHNDARLRLSGRFEPLRFASSGNGVVLLRRSWRERVWFWNRNVIHHKTAIFRQLNLTNPNTHHDALEFPDGQVVLLTLLHEGQQATVLQLPASAGVKAEQEAVRASEVSPPLHIALGTLTAEASSFLSEGLPVDEVRAGEHFARRCPPARYQASSLLIVEWLTA